MELVFGRNLEMNDLDQPLGGNDMPRVGEPATIMRLPTQEIVQGCHELNMVGCDLAGVSPSYDSSGKTAPVGANLP